MRRIDRLCRALEGYATSIFAVALLGAALALGIHAWVHPITDSGPDGEIYEMLGAETAGSDHFFGCGNFRNAYWSPGWVATVAALYRVTGREPLAIRLFLVAVALATAWLVFLMARRLAGASAAFVAALLFVFSKLVFKFTAAFQYELPVAFLTVLAGYLFFFAPNAARTKGGNRVSAVGPRVLACALAAGAVLGAAALFSPRVLALLPLALVCFILDSGWSRAAVRALAVLVGVWLVLLPWGVRNHRCYGEWIFTTSNGGINLYIANNPNSTGDYDPPPDEGWPAFEPHDSRAWTREALGYMADHPVQTAGRAFVKALRFWRPHYGDQYLVLPLFIAGWIRLRRSRRERSAALLWTLAVPFIYMLVHMVFFVQVRYMIPALPFVAIVAGAGACGWRGSAAENSSSSPVRSDRHST